MSVASQKRKLFFSYLKNSDRWALHSQKRHTEIPRKEISIPYGEGISALLAEDVKINIWLQTEAREFIGPFSLSHKTQFLHALQKSAALESSPTVCLLLTYNRYTRTKLWRNVLVLYICMESCHVPLSLIEEGRLGVCTAILCGPPLMSLLSLPAEGRAGQCCTLLSDLCTVSTVQHKHAS